jgi:hypothetical protein
MIDFKAPETSWNLLFLASLGLIGAATWFGFFAPMPETAHGNLKEIQALSLKTEDHTKERLKTIEERTWNVGGDVLASTALNRLTLLAESKGLQLSTFRSDKAATAAGLEQTPIVAVVEGSFPNVVAFGKSLDGSKLGLESLQITASDAAPGKVSATLGLIGYRYAEVK